MAVSRKVPPRSGPLPDACIIPEDKLRGTGEVWVSEAEVTHSCFPRGRTSVALWSTGCSPGGITIGRMTTTGTVTVYAVQNISSPVDITAGPDGAMWFSASGNVIGRITTSVTPTISRFTPTSGPAGTTVTITGLNPGRATKVSFGGTAATIVSDTATLVVTKVLTGELTGPILVTTAAGTATSIKNFKVT